MRHSDMGWGHKGHHPTEELKTYHLSWVSLSDFLEKSDENFDYNHLLVLSKIQYLLFIRGLVSPCCSC